MPGRLFFVVDGVLDGAGAVVTAAEAPFDISAAAPPAAADCTNRRREMRISRSSLVSAPC
jgi:hypothetical protein